MYIFSVNNDLVFLSMTSNRLLHKMVWRERDGPLAEQVEYYNSGNYGPDANRTFDFSGLVVFTDAIIGVTPTYMGKIKVKFI